MAEAVGLASGIIGVFAQAEQLQRHLQDVQSKAKNQHKRMALQTILNGLPGVLSALEQVAQLMQSDKSSGALAVEALADLEHLVSSIQAQIARVLDIVNSDFTSERDFAAFDIISRRLRDFIACWRPSEQGISAWSLAHGSATDHLLAGGKAQSAEVEEYTKKLTARQRQAFSQTSFRPDVIRHMMLPFRDDDTHRTHSKGYRIHSKDVQVMFEKPPQRSDDEIKKEILSQDFHYPMWNWKGRYAWSSASRLQLHLAVCPAASSAGSIALSTESYVAIMDRFRLPVDFLALMHSGTPTFKQVERQLSLGSRMEFIMRMPLATSNNWTLAMRYDFDGFDTYALLHGVTDSELDELTAAMDDFKAVPAHPLMLPTLLCQLLTESDSIGIKKQALSLYTVELRTNYLRIGDSFLETSRSERKTPEDNLEGLTRLLNAVVSRLAFHEMRVTANIALVASILSSMRVLESAHLDTFNLAHHRKNEDQNNVEECLVHARLQQRLVSLQEEHASLLNEIACNQKIAAGQLKIVYSLIAQRDTQESLRVTSISTSIAAITRDDSFAMRTIAVMTVAFLPATAVSSIFSMDLFDWQAETGAAVLSRRFWIYLAIAIPLTIFVLIAWWLRTRTRQKHEQQAHKISGVELRPRDKPFQLSQQIGRLKDKAHSLQARVRNKSTKTSQYELSDLEANMTGVETSSTRTSFDADMQEIKPAGVIVRGPIR